MAKKRKWKRRSRKSEAGTARTGNALFSIRGGAVPLVLTEAAAPSPTVTPLFMQSMADIMRAHDEQLAAKLAIHREAERFNTLLTSWPEKSLLGKMRLRPWHYPRPKRRKRCRK